jgi:hypothetical protein
MRYVIMLYLCHGDWRTRSPFRVRSGATLCFCYKLSTLDRGGTLFAEAPMFLKRALAEVACASESAPRRNALLLPQPRLASL